MKPWRIPLLLLLPLALPHSAPKQGPAPREPAVPAAAQAGEALHPAEAGARLIWAFLYKKPVDSIAQYFEDEVRPSLTKENIETIQSQISWLPKMLGDNLEIFMSGSRAGENGKTEFFREYRFANEYEKRTPLVVIQVWYADSMVNKAAGAFVKTFLDNGERRLAGEQTWNFGGTRAEIHSVVLVELERGLMLAVKVYDGDTAQLDEAAGVSRAGPFAREAVARGWLDSAQAQARGSAKNLLEDVGVVFIRKDPQFGYSHFKYGVRPEEFGGSAPKKPAKKK